MDLAIGQTGHLIALAETEGWGLWITNRPAAARFREHLQRLTLLGRNNELLGWRNIAVRIRLIERPERRISDCAEACLRDAALRRRSRRRAGARAMGLHARGGCPTGQTQPVHFADHGVARNTSEPTGDLAGAQPFRPESLQLLDALFRPAHLVAPYRISSHPIRGTRTGTRRASSGSCDTRTGATQHRHAAWPLQTLELGVLDELAPTGRVGALELETTQILAAQTCAAPPYPVADTHQATT